MKNLLFKTLVFALLGTCNTAEAQRNCLLEKDSACRRACEMYTASTFAQGSLISQMLYDTIIAICPTYSDAYSAKSTPFIKRGDFATWKKLTDEAVRLDPIAHLDGRGWSRFKFLHDYEGAIADLNELERLQGRTLSGYSGDGNYHLRMVRALCRRELGELSAALVEMDSLIAEQEANDWIGLYDYLHRGVTHLRLGNVEAALFNFQKQVEKYPRSAESHYHLGRALLQNGKHETAKLCFETALRCFNGEGYQMNDPYTAFLDQVYPSDAEEALLEIEK